MYNHDLDKLPLNLSFNGFYRGIVLDVNDPLKAGRLKIRIHSVYDDVQEDAIPWAEYADTFFSKGLFLPDVGDTVWCFFDNGSHMHPVFFAGSQSSTQHPSEKDSNSTYAKNRVFKLKGGHKLEFDDTGSGRINIEHGSGTRMTFMPNGDVILNVTNNLIQNISGDITTTVGGSVSTSIGGSSNTSVSGSSELSASSINQSSSGSSSYTAGGAMSVSGSPLSLN